MGKLLKHKFSAKKTEDNSNENIERCKKKAIKAWNRRASNGTD